jgi:hypothetical protein
VLSEGKAKREAVKQTGGNKGKVGNTEVKRKKTIKKNTYSK